MNISDISQVGSLTLDDVLMEGNIQYLTAEGSCKPFNDVVVPEEIIIGDGCDCSIDGLEKSWFVEGASSNRLLQSDVFAYRGGLDQGALDLEDESAVDSIVLIRPNIVAVFFNSSSTLQDREFVKNEILGLSSFEVILPVFSESLSEVNPYSERKWFYSDGGINIGFRSPIPSQDQVEYIATKYNLGVQHIPSPTLPVGPHSWTYMFSVKETNCSCRNPADLARIIYEQDSSIVRFSEPSMEPITDPSVSINDPYF